MDHPTWLDASTAWYNTNAVRFAEDADRCNPGRDQQAFLAALPAGGTVLDVGCGSGRDIAVFERAGRSCVGWEPSPSLAAIAATKVRGPILTQSLDDLPGSGPWAGVWAMGVLLHTPLNHWQRHLAAIAGSLAPGGVAAVAIKDGNGEGMDARGRPFAALGLDALRSIFPHRDDTTWRVDTTQANESSGRIVTWHTVWAQRASS
jgi:SAM-dependent methyltransferase